MLETLFFEPYHTEFFEQLREGSQKSAEVIVPLILDWIYPQKVVDVGCGDGTWLSVFQSQGVKEILGLDGDYVAKDTLQISRESFISYDLSQLFSLNRHFDLAISLEVAEHLPPESAEGFIESLVKLSPVILFSAAIPYQGGTHHLNEQWPDYWIKKFKNQRYIALDILRSKIWQNPAVEPWYAQNSFLFVKEDCLPNYPALQQAADSASFQEKAIVHPSIYLKNCPKSQDNQTETELSKIIQILDVTLYPSSEIQRGESLTITIVYKMMTPVDSAIFNISLSNEAGLILIDTEQFLELPQNSSPHSIKLHIERLDLVQGKYFINPGIFSLDWVQTYDFYWHCYPLSLQGTDSQKGLIEPLLYWQS